MTAAAGREPHRHTDGCFDRIDGRVVCVDTDPLFYDGWECIHGVSLAQPCHRCIPQAHDARPRSGFVIVGIVLAIAAAIAIAALFVYAARTAPPTAPQSGAAMPAGFGAPSGAPLNTAASPGSTLELQPGRHGGAPIPASGGASSEVEGVATWCAPTPSKCQRWGGAALLGATPSYTGQPYWATVTHGSRRVTVRVVSWCACGDRGGRQTVIDLSPAAFRRLAPLSRGVIDVILVSGSVTPPATDTEP